MARITSSADRVITPGLALLLIALVAVLLLGAIEEAIRAGHRRSVLAAADCAALLQTQLGRFHQYLCERVCPRPGG